MYLGCGCMKSALPGCCGVQVLFHSVWTIPNMYRTHTLHQPVHLLLCAWCVFISVLWLWSRVHHPWQQWRGTSGVLHWEHLQGKPSTMYMSNSSPSMLYDSSWWSNLSTQNPRCSCHHQHWWCVLLLLYEYSSVLQYSTPVPNHSWTCYLASYVGGRLLLLMTTGLPVLCCVERSPRADPLKVSCVDIIHTSTRDYRRSGNFHRVIFLSLSTPTKINLRGNRWYV